MRASARELLVPFLHFWYEAVAGFEPTTSRSESGRSTNLAIEVVLPFSKSILSNNKSSGKPVQTCRFARGLAAHIHTVWMWMKTQTKISLLGTSISKFNDGFCAYAWMKVFRINPEFRILRLTFHRKSASKC